MEPPCKTEDDCPTPTWCRGKDRCPKRYIKDKANGRLAGADCSLLPCPFCGSEDVGYYAYANVIRCHNCGTEGPIDSERDQGREVAAEVWNRRANDQGMP
jgi:Lar family restriction alleviation protein